MGRLLALSGKAVCRILESHGFVEVRRRGSHVVMQRRLAGGTITVPVPDHDELKTGTLLSIVRQSGVPRSTSRFEHKGGARLTVERWRGGPGGALTSGDAQEGSRSVRGLHGTAF
ncbi:MAG: type II toxin-antitoxin system HicA family toxin [Candidatus Riflebacteria bacterium]|nr:type II toxin-antitoxin system HicA family toxin [Candidatus Riflebacteria bacterium]